MAEELKTKIREDMNAARRERDRLRTTVLTTVLSEIRNREIERKRDASDDDVVEVVSSAIKRRQEAAEQMRAGSRVELAEKGRRSSSRRICPLRSRRPRCARWFATRWSPVPRIWAR